MSSGIFGQHLVSPADDLDDEMWRCDRCGLAAQFPVGDAINARFTWSLPCPPPLRADAGSMNADELGYREDG